MLAICPNFYRVTENYRASTEMNRKLQRNTGQSQSITENFTQTFCPYRARTGVDETSIEILQLQSDDAFAVRFLLNCAVALMTATAEFQ